MRPIKTVGNKLQRTQRAGRRCACCPPFFGAPMSQEYLTPPQVAKLLQTNSNKVLGWIHSGELPAIDIAQTRGGRPRWRIKAADLDAFLDRRTATPAPKQHRRRRKADADLYERY